ncbi:hypothetical protein ABPG74_017499 [Tetrahymena malaccensis]
MGVCYSEEQKQNAVNGNFNTQLDNNTFGGYDYKGLQTQNKQVYANQSLANSPSKNQDFPTTQVLKNGTQNQGKETYNIYNNQQDLGQNHQSNNSYAAAQNGFNSNSSPSQIINNENIQQNRETMRLSRKKIPQLQPFIYGLDPPDEKNKHKEFRQAQRLPNGSTYVGEWFADKMHGKGILTWPDGSKYEGFFVEGMRQGRGRFTSSDGDIYEGEWKGNKADGYGTQYTEISTYTGEWKDDQQHGMGEEEWIDGSKYKGEYFKGKKHGKGIFVWFDQTQYEGQFEDGQINGNGIMSYHNGKRYEGEFKDGRLHGKGFFTWPDRKQYQGEYVEDKKHGKGVFIWPDGRKYEGYWVNGQQHGIGIFYDRDGIPRKGEWENGQRKRWLEEDINASNRLLADPRNKLYQSGNSNTYSQNSNNVFGVNKQFQSNSNIIRPFNIENFNQDLSNDSYNYGSQYQTPSHNPVTFKNQDEVIMNNMGYDNHFQTNSNQNHINTPSYYQQNNLNQQYNNVFSNYNSNGGGNQNNEHLSQTYQNRY